MRKVVLPVALALTAITAQNAPAQPANPSQPVVRYQYGDNPAWAAPGFDDSSWPAAAQGSWPIPAFHSDGFVWIRVRMPVPAGSSSGLAIRLSELKTLPAADRVFVNGRDAGGEGGFPPQGQPVYARASQVCLLPEGAAAPGTTALVAVRLWYLPDLRFNGGFGQFQLRIADVETAHLAERASQLSATLGRVPDLAANALLALLGIGLLVFWFQARRTELLWCAALLISYPIYETFFDATDLGFLSISILNWRLLYFLLTFLTMIATVEFIWTVHGLRARGWRRAAYLSSFLFNAAAFAARSGVHASALIAWSHTATIVFVQIFNLITLGASLWVLLVRRYNRAIAAAMSVIPFASCIAFFGLRESWFIGTVYVDLFNLGFLLSGFAIAAMLIRRAIAAWRQGDQLRIEFAAAREIQRRLVPAALPDFDHFRFHAVYLPAAEVGGDFYQVFPEDDGAALIVVGDVSGKGLKAAMTGTLVIGALRMVAHEGFTPSKILSRLNAQLAQSSDGGFVTCLVARVTTDRTLTLANAGHLAPYRNGEEIPLDSGLPLGITADATWSESTLQLDSGDALVLLSDGVVEARNAAGELFGFERTAAIASQSAQSIAGAAQRFGQEDDITVLTLAFAPAEVLHA
jgi:hypothetical protein